ncbi:hypothetical protein [Maridesulfovibrio sp.]|uniref:hypothetical protein n=1 Tax=Maridesulfovibrio sp. TaxID=2795000 RepID=UPI0029CA6ACA|nr:hypothetical protein [Maridesulfovibrio sp.]
MNKDKDHIVRQKCRENVIGFAPFRYRFGKESLIREGLLNIGKFEDHEGGHLVLTFIFDSDSIMTDNDILDRMARLDFGPLIKKGLLTALRNSAEFEQNEDFAMHEFSFYFDKMPKDIPKLIKHCFIPFFLDNLYMRIGDIEWMERDAGRGWLCRLKDSFHK